MAEETGNGPQQKLHSTATVDRFRLTLTITSEIMLCQLVTSEKHMKYQWNTQTGALREGVDDAFAEAVAASVLQPVRKSSAEPVTNLLSRRIPSEVIRLVPASVARENLVVPISADAETLVLAAVDANDIAVADKLRFLLAKNIRLLPAPAHDVRKAVEKFYGRAEADACDTMISEFTETAIDFDDDDFCDDAAPPRQVSSNVRDRRLGLSDLLRDAGPTSLGGPVEFKRGYGLSPRRNSVHYSGRSGMFYFTVDEGERILMTDRSGRSQILSGPRRVWKGRNRFEAMPATVAHPGEFLIIRYRDGRQENLPGPAEVWFDRRVHSSIEKQDALQIGANEAIVVYTKADDSDGAARRVETGPMVFVPKPGEWLHTFQWHAAKGGSQGAPKVAKGLVFQKLWLMPDQMYHDVPDVRTADDAVLTIRLMIFFELQDVRKMLDTTHDPVGDFVNAATADVVEFTGRHDFETFKQQTHKLNDLTTYQTLLNRAAQVGYRINNVVYRGYGAPDSLQQMHDQAIEARTRLQLERATEQQAQQLEDFKLESQLARSAKRRSEQADEVRHEMGLNREKQDADRLHKEAQANLARDLQAKSAEQSAEIMRRQNEIHLEQLQALKELGVDLTSYLTQARADQVIEVRGNGSMPHLHLDRTDDST